MARDTGESRARPGAPQAALEALFAELRFADPAKAAALWSRIDRFGDPPAARPERVARLLEEIASSADPDLALLNFVRFAEATIAPGAFFNSIVQIGRAHV